MPTSNTAKHLDLYNEMQPVQDLYFLDRNIALQSAQLNKQIQTESGLIREQICYYDGDAIENAPLNLINVPANKFTMFFIMNSLPLPSKVIGFADSDSNTEQEIGAIFGEMVSQIIKSRSNKYEKWEGHPPFVDTYFLDARVAYQTAVQQNRVFVGHPSITGLQVCYYAGPKIEGGPNNLIHVPVDELLEYLSNCRTRLPRDIVYPIDVHEEEVHAGSQSFKELVKTAREFRLEMSKEFTQLAKNIKPEFNVDEPLRIFFIADRRTTVLQYASKYLSKSFEKLGQEVFVSIEANELEELDAVWYLKEYLDFKPHVVININHRNNSWLHPDIINIVWYQDPTPEIMTEKKLTWRDNDIVLSAYKEFDTHIIATGVKNVLRQSLCIDSNVFKIYPKFKKTRKVVFIGSSYFPHIRNESTQVKNVVNSLINDFSSGVPLTREYIAAIAEKENIPFKNLWHYRLNYVVRDTTVRWLCEAPDIDVEIYGRYWEYDSVISKHFKGELDHGDQVSRVYNSSVYALVSLPFEINSQRLAECSACGCIPVVYDCRYHAEPPHWDNDCLFFRTKDELYDCLNNVPTGDPTLIAKNYTYDVMANRLLPIILDSLGCCGRSK